jgi:hypothetical protein
LARRDIDPAILLCGCPDGRAIDKGFRRECSVCSSFWDLDSLRRRPEYERSYPERRGHYDPGVGRLKVKSLQRWLKKTRLQIRGKTILEFGFGGGFTLKFLSELNDSVFGVETVAENISHARSLGIPAAQLFLFDALPDRLERRPDVWLFLDSFEHLEDPVKFTRWLSENSASGAKVLIVAPNARSLSRSLMGRLWIHKLPDHLFHWSSNGLAGFMERAGFRVEKRFYPLKFVSLGMVASHLWIKILPGRPAPRFFSLMHRIRVPFNFGEMGFLFCGHAPTER